MLRLFLWSALVGCSIPVLAQSSAPASDSLPWLRDSFSVTITAARMETPLQRLPFAVHVLDQQWIQRAQAQRSLGEALVAIPGVYAWNTDNYSQDLRISVRGFGARSAFGVRGIRVFTDGIPDTSPDGQTDLDNLDMGAVASIEALRGTAAGLYGNAAGGVLWIQTEQPTERYVSAQWAAGAFGFQRWQVKAALPKGRSGLFVSVSQMALDGYRAQSRTRQTIANVKWQYRFSEKTKSTLLLNYGASPYALDPGGLTDEQRTTDPQQARTASAQFNTGERVQQGRLGYTLQHTLNERHQITATAFVTARDFDNRLPFQNGGWVDLVRYFGGGTLTHTYTNARFRLQTGVDAGVQRDQRKRYDNLAGQRGNLTFDQSERFAGAGVFVLTEVFLTQKISATAALRADVVRLKAIDQFNPTVPVSSSSVFRRTNPTVGIRYALRPNWMVYTNAGTHFETPTLNELSANPEETGGFNATLKPQQSAHGEIGTRLTPNARFQWELAVFYIALRNELVPYQLPATPGRTYFRNAGTSRRTGVETAVRYRFGRHWTVLGQYNYGDFRYKNYEASGVQYDGNYLPALPLHRGLVALTWQSRRWFATAQAQLQTGVFADDANLVKDRGYALVSARGGWEWARKKWQISPFFGVNNLLGAAYSNNILINAAANRYFEPGPHTANVYGGITIKIR
jgi:iron complex outermembrane recepter protein